MEARIGRIMPVTLIFSSGNAVGLNLYVKTHLLCKTTVSLLSLTSPGKLQAKLLLNSQFQLTSSIISDSYSGLRVIEELIALEQRCSRCSRVWLRIWGGSGVGVRVGLLDARTQGTMHIRCSSSWSPAYPAYLWLAKGCCISSHKPFCRSALDV